MDQGVVIYKEDMHHLLRGLINIEESLNTDNIENARFVVDVLKRNVANNIFGGNTDEKQI